MWKWKCGSRAWPKISHEKPTILHEISTPGFQSHNIQVHAWEVGKYKSDILYIFGYLCLTAITAILQSTVDCKNNCAKFKLKRLLKCNFFSPLQESELPKSYYRKILKRKIVCLPKTLFFLANKFVVWKVMFFILHTTSFVCKVTNDLKSILDHQLQFL